MILRWSSLAAVVAAAVLVAAAVAVAQERESPGRPVGVFPVPGTTTASPSTEISFRGVSADRLGDIVVEGSRTGRHAGRLVPHSDGEGASFVPARPFRAGERVTVRTSLDVAGARDGDWSFRTTGRPREGLGSGSPPPRSLAQQLFAQRGRAPEGAVPRYRSRPDLRPPEIQVIRRARRGVAPGYVFISPKKVFGARERPGLQAGPMIVDNRGEPVWFAPLTDGNVNDFRVQTYRGRPVLTWWQGRQVLGTGEGEISIVDASYRTIARVRAGNGYQLDFHEATITERGTLLALVYSPVAWDLRPVGGPRNGRVIDSIVQEIDIATGRVVFEWHSLRDVPITDGYGRHPVRRTQPYDYFHVNSVREDTDGNLLVSARDTHAIYKLDRRTGRVLWRLGGKRSSFRLQRSARPAWQHDVQRDPDGTLRIFDNQAAPRRRPRSRVLWLRLDEQAMTARLARQFEHPDDLSSGTQGNAQALPNGNTFIGWGSQGYFTEITRGGRVLFDARVARGNDTYRAYRAEWTGMPRERPALAAERRGDRTVVYASWNGATEVASWQVLAGSAPDRLTRVGARRPTGFETAISVRTTAPYVAVRARDASGRVLATSPVRRVRAGR
jgi:hypothetical protein